MKFPLTTMRESCFATLAYFDLFDYPLTLPEIQRYFLGKQPGRETLEYFLDSHARQIGFREGYYFLKGRENLVEIRRQRELIAERLWSKARFYLPFIRFVPFVKMVGVCNTLAIDNPTKESDIDLFIVAGRKRLFFVRFLTVFLFGALGVRRHGNRIAGRFCLSFYVDEETMNLQAIQQSERDIYLPFWIATMKPVYGLHTYERFMKDNDWIKTYFDRDIESKRDFFKSGKFWRFWAWLKEKFWNGRLGDYVEAKLGYAQLKRHERNLYHLGKDASVVVSEHMLKFHNIDRRSDIARRFERRLEEVLAF